jgi:hypothetical protein
MIWGAWLGAIQTMDGIHWAAELWTGTLFLAVLEGLGLGLLAFPRIASPAQDERTSATIATTADVIP